MEHRPPVGICLRRSNGPFVLCAAGAPDGGCLSTGFSTSLKGADGSPTPYRALHGSTWTPLGISIEASPDPGCLAAHAPAAFCAWRLVSLFPPIGQWVNNPTLTEFCFGMIGRADIEGSKSNVAMNAWLPQASSVIPATDVARPSLGPGAGGRPRPLGRA